MGASVTSIVPRHPLIAKAVDDDALMEAVVAYLTGADDATVATHLQATELHTKRILGSAQWRFMCRSYADEVRNLASNRLSRIVNKAFDQIEKRIDEGDPIAVTDDDGNTQIIGYRPLKGKDLSSIAQQMAGVQKDIDRRLAGVIDGGIDVAARELAMALAAIGKASQEGKVIDWAKFSSHPIDVTPE